MVASLDRVRVIWEGTGTGSPISLGSAINARFAAPTSALNTLAPTYLIEHQGEGINEVELGRGVYTHSGATLARTEIIWSTNGGFGGSAVDFSAGVKHVSLGLSATDLGALVGLDQVTATEIATAAVTADKILAGAVSYDKIAAASKRAVTATPTEGIFVLDDANSGRAFRAEEALEFEIAEGVSKDSWWELIGRSSGVTVAIEGDVGNIVFNGANVDEVTLLDGYDGRLTVEANAGTAPNVAASGGFSGAIATPPGPVTFTSAVTLGTNGSISDTGPISASGALTKAVHGGRAVLTTGNVTIPNAAGDVGMGGIIILGGAHTITFNSTVTGTLAAGDVFTYYVQSTTVLRRSLQTAATQPAMS